MSLSSPVAVKETVKLEVSDIPLIDFDNLSRIWFNEPYNPAVHTMINTIISTIIGEATGERALATRGKGHSYDPSDMLNFFFRLKYRGVQLLRSEGGNNIVYHIGFLDSGPLLSLKVSIKDKGKGKKMSSRDYEYNIGKELSLLADKTPNFVKVYDRIFVEESIEGPDGTIILFPKIAGVGLGLARASEQESFPGKANIAIFEEYIPAADQLGNIIKNLQPWQNVSLLLQTLISLYIAEQEIGFVHHDLSSRNLLVRSVEGWLQYSSKLERDKVFVKNDILINSFGNQIVIIDFDQASTYTTNSKDSRRNEDIYFLKIIREFERFAPVEQKEFFSQLATIISNELKIISIPVKPPGVALGYQNISIEDIIQSVGNALEDTGLLTEEFDNLVTTASGATKVLKCGKRGTENIKCSNLLDINKRLPVTDVAFPYLHFAYLLNQSNSKRGISLYSLVREEQALVVKALDLHIQYYQQIAIDMGKKNKFTRFAFAIKSLKYLAHVLELLQVPDNDPGKETLGAFLSETIGDFREAYPGKKKLIRAIN